MLPVCSLGVCRINTIHVFNDRESCRAEGIGQKECTCVSTVRGNARTWEFVVVVRRKGASDHGAGSREVNRQLVGDCRMLDIGNTFWCKEGSENVTILAGFAGCERCQRTDRQAKIETNAVQMAGSDASTGQDKQTMFRKELANLVNDREDSFGTAVHDGAATNFDDLEPGKNPSRANAGNGTSEITVLKGLACKRRGDVLDGIGCISHGVLNSQ